MKLKIANKIMELYNKLLRKQPHGVTWGKQFNGEATSTRL